MRRKLLIAKMGMAWMCCQSTYASTGALFNVSAEGLGLTIRSTIPHHNYPAAGIKINTPGYTLAGPTIPSGNGYSLFTVSDTHAAHFTLSGASGDVEMNLCLNGVANTYSCETQTHTISNANHVIFITSSTFRGNLGGAAGADSICQTVAYQAGSIIPAGYTFKALLVTDTRYPCSSLNGGSSGSCGPGYDNNWPLTPGITYLNPDKSVFNTVNLYAVFDGSNPTLCDETGAVSSNKYWSGVQSVFSNTDGTDIAAWAYTDMNRAADGLNFSRYFAACTPALSPNQAFTSTNGRGSIGTSGAPAGVEGTAASSAWGNYYYFDDTSDSYFYNQFVESVHSSCASILSIVCVS